MNPGTKPAVLKAEHQLRRLPSRATATTAARPSRLAPAGSSGLLHQRHRRQPGPGCLPCPLRSRRLPQPAPASSHDSQSPGLYAYATGVFSSRKIARRLHEDIAFRVLAAHNFPAHRTIREFRALHLAEFTELFVQVVCQVRGTGLTKFGAISLVRSKIKANANRYKALRCARMQTA